MFTGAVKLMFSIYFKALNVLQLFFSSIEAFTLLNELPFKPLLKINDEQTVWLP